MSDDRLLQRDAQLVDLGLVAALQRLVVLRARLDDEREHLLVQRQLAAIVLEQPLLLLRRQLGRDLGLGGLTLRDPIGQAEPVVVGDHLGLHRHRGVEAAAAGAAAAP